MSKEIDCCAPCAILRDTVLYGGGGGGGGGGGVMYKVCMYKNNALIHSPRHVDVNWSSYDCLLMLRFPLVVSHFFFLELADCCVN